MTFYRTAVASLCMHAAPLPAIELINATEKGKLVEIERELSVDKMLIEADDRLSMLMKREHAHADLAKELKLKQARYDETVAALPAAILQKSNPRGLYAELESLVKAIEGLKQKAVSEQESVAAERKSIAAEYACIEARRTTRSTKPLELKTSIAGRLSEVSSVQGKTEEGTMKCSKFKSMLC